MSSVFEEGQLMEGFWVDDWLIKPLLNRASRNGEEVSVEPKVMEVLLCLARHAGKTVTKEHFMEQVWADTVVTEDVLARCISELRKLFGDDSRAPRFIETIRKTGYRLIASVALAASDLERRSLPGEAMLAPGVERRPLLSLPTLWSLLWKTLKARGWQYALQPLNSGSVAVVLVMLIGGALWVWSASTLDTLAPPVTVPFTSYPGQELGPTFSPDGNQVAFAWDNNTGRDFDIYVKQAGAEPPLRITDERTDEHSPAWSPDGLHLAFIRSSRDQQALFIVPAIGGGERKVVDFGVRNVQGIAWSPDGQAVAVSAQRSPYQSFSLFLVVLDSARVQPLTTPPAHYLGDRRPAFSPDGKRLAFTRSIEEGLADLYVVRAQGGEPERLTADHVDITGLDWTVEGKHVVFASQRGGTSGLWRISASGGEPEWIVTASEGAQFQDLSIAQQGDRLAYVQRSSNTNIWQLSRARSSPEYRAHLLISSTRWDSNPQISPDGNRIVFASNQSGTYEIWTCDRDGANPVQLTSFEGGRVDTPRWSPEGAFIAFVAYRDGQGDIYVVDAQGGAPQQLTTTPDDDVAPSWSRDGQSIYFASNQRETWQIWSVPSAGGEAVQVTTTGGRMAFESPDGTLLYYVKPTTPGIWQMALSPLPDTTRRERLLIASLEPSDWGNWAIGAKGLYFVRRDEYDPLLAFYDIETEQVRRIAPLRNVPMHPGLAVAPDETWFLYTQVDRDESDILLMDYFR